jgi:hypothetical protein
MIAANIGNDATVGQALFMVGSATFEHGTVLSGRLRVTYWLLMEEERHK